MCDIKLKSQEFFIRCSQKRAKNTKCALLQSLTKCHIAQNNSKLVGGGVETWQESSKESKLSIFAIQVKSQNAYSAAGFNTWPQQETRGKMSSGLSLYNFPRANLQSARVQCVVIDR